MLKADYLLVKKAFDLRLIFVQYSILIFMFSCGIIYEYGGIAQLVRVHA